MNIGDMPSSNFSPANPASLYLSPSNSTNSMLSSLLLCGALLCAAAALSIFFNQNGKKIASTLGLSHLLAAKPRANQSRASADKKPTVTDPPMARNAVDDKAPPQPEGEEEDSEMAEHKLMYYNLHNLENEPQVLSSARKQLIALFAETLAKARTERPTESILSLDHYSKEGLEKFMYEYDDRVSKKWEDYIARRKAGGERELVRDHEEARWWLRQIAPVKFVDGAWLGYINKSTLPFRLRNEVKHSWQVLSEELGDGDLEKNHAYLFKTLVKSVAPDLPDADSLDFINPKHGLNEPLVWKAALGQMLISLFPHEFFPEILGFNMHFEAIALETLQASKELQEVGLNAYYFLLHVSIDNADSGHTAIAKDAVIDYIERVRATQGEAAAHQAWRRVQVGYTMSDRLPGSAKSPSMIKAVSADEFPRNELEAEVIKLFEAKAIVAHKIHTHCEVKIGGRKLSYWLDPAIISQKEKQMEFLDKFSREKAWIHRGNASKSRFIRLLGWGGRMFGAFTATETVTVMKWIDAMSGPSPRLYWDFTGREDDVTSEIDSQMRLSYKQGTQSFKAADPSNAYVQTSPDPPALSLGLEFDKITMPNVQAFIPLWFAHSALLETFVSIPYKTTTPFACAMVRILRAQSGFGLESNLVAGTDEAHRSNESIGLVELGLEMMRKWNIPEPESLKEVTEKYHCDFVVTMLNLAIRPFTHRGLLVGMALAFANLHDEMSASSLVGRDGKQALRLIARREQENLAFCVKDLNEKEYKDCCRGYWMAAGKIHDAFAT